MKKLNLFGVFILSITILAGGCHRKPNTVTPIPGIEAPPGQNGNNPNIPEGQRIENVPAVRGTDEGITASTRTFDGPQDHTTLAAETVYFDFDRATIKSTEESKLQQVADYLKGHPNDLLIIEGNCDERGTEKYNLSLGERRSLASREYLANLGIDASRIKTVTYGASRPVDPGHKEEAWRKNRRDDFVLVTK